MTKLYEKVRKVARGNSVNYEDWEHKAGEDAFFIPMQIVILCRIIMIAISILLTVFMIFRFGWGTENLVLIVSFNSPLIVFYLWFLR